MAERRMFAKTIIDSDSFLDMPISAQLLYFHLSMRADDDGFINKPKTIMRMIGSSEDDIKLLIAKKFLIPFESGVVVIKHWKIHNYIAKDRYTETKYKDEKAMLSLDENKSYTICIQPVDELETQDRLGKDRIGKVSLEEDIEDVPDTNVGNKRPVKHKYGEYKHVLLTNDEMFKLSNEYGLLAEECITFLDEYIEMKGYKAKSHYLAIRKWVVDAVQEQKRRKNNNKGNEPLSSSRIDWIDDVEVPEGW